MKLLAPAKLNLTLEVLGKRSDGYHELRSVMVPISLADEITLEPRENGITLETDGCNCDVEHNLAYRAARLFFDETGISGGVHIHMEKHIPVGAGLGGGSSDASTVLLGLNDLFGAGLDEKTLMELASRLGADCPFFILRRPLLMGGRGDEVLGEVSLGGCAFLLVIPPFGMSTPEVYAGLKMSLTPEQDAFKIGFTKSTSDFNIDWNDAMATERWLKNDLEVAAMHMRPELKRIKQELCDAGALGTLMSGSGSTVFGVFKDPDHVCCAMRLVPRHEGYDYIPTTRLTGENVWKLQR